MKKMEFCDMCPYFKGDIRVMFEKRGRNLAMSVVNKKTFGKCVMLTDLESIRDIARTAEDFVKMVSGSEHYRARLLKPHVTEIVEQDSVCPYKAEILMSQWNEGSE